MNVRLSKFVIPIKYQITIRPDLETFLFEGEETIDLIFKKSTKSITLHSKELKIEAVKTIRNYELHPNDIQFASNIKYDENTETATFSFPKTISKGKIQLRLSFKGLLNDKLRGFYRSKYFHQGKEKHLATTQFEATDARKAFPCFDEPAQKAIFEISFIIPKQLTAISNTMPIDVLHHSESHKIVKFAPTPKMSTYLLAFIVGEFEYVEGKTKENVLVRVYTTPGKKHQAKFALSCGIKMLEFYNKYFDIKYPLNTLDLIAIPDFAHGAMENWGAITYRETALLIDEEHSSSSSKQNVALVIAHEIAHQWFGNLVTMEWWTHLWLNEGFASYIEYLAVNHVFPAWDIWTQFAYNDMGVALTLDAFKNTHPIEIEVHHPNEISEIFDTISYSKGASVIRMLAGYLGEKDFRNGLRYYLKKYSYSNASTEHLWQAFEKVSKKPVGKIMRNWIKKAGYPILEITDGLKLKQKRFFSQHPQHLKEKTLWQIPVNIKNLKDNKNSQILVNSENFKLSCQGNQFYKFNFGETGFYRTKYPAGILENLKPYIRNKNLPPIDRLGIIRDAFALAFSGQNSSSGTLELLKSYINEDDFTVWVEIVSGLDNFLQLLFRQKIYSEFEKYGQYLLKNIINKVGWQPKKGEEHTKILLRSLVLNASGTYGNKDVVKRAREEFSKKTIHPDLRGVVYNLIAKNGQKREFSQLLNLYKKTSFQEEQKRILRAMAEFKNQSQIKEFLDFTISSNVRSQDAPLALAHSVFNPYSRDFSWQFIKKNWPMLLERYGQGGHLLSRIIQPLWNYNDTEQLKEIKEFFKTHQAPGCERTIAQILEKIESNANWLKNISKELGITLI